MKKTLGVTGGLVIVAALALVARGQETAPAVDVEKIVKTFLEGPWQDLEAQLAKMPKNGAGLNASEKADLTYIFQALQDGRPAWWKQCKAGKAMIKTTIWGRPLPMVFDPKAKQSLQFQTIGGAVNVTVAWPVADMDNPAEAEHGFSVGELNALGVWQQLGMADTWATLPQTAMLNLTPAQNEQLTRFMDFRGTVSGVYFSPPRSRRWGLWLACSGYMEKYSKMTTVMSRKALAAMFVAEVVGHREKYPTLDLPAPFPEEKPEENLALHIKDWMEKHGWTVAEDRNLREAIRGFAAANEKTPRETGKVTLPNGLFVALDPTQDIANRPKRDAWLKTQWDKATTRPAK